MTSSSDPVRVLIPDHPALAVGQAIEFSGVLRRANDPDEDGSEPWRLPATLTDPLLEEALDAAVTRQPWAFNLGDLDASTAITVAHSDVGHMGLYVTTITREQLDRLLAAAALLTAPAQREVTEFVEAWREEDRDGDGDASLAGWLAVVGVLACAVADAPTIANRPAKLFNVEGVLAPALDTASTSPARDTAVVLAAIDAAGGRAVDLDLDEFWAWRRLMTEWHTAIYSTAASGSEALLQSYAY